MDTPALEQYLKTYKDGLLEDILPFWEKYALDREDGGFTFCLDRDGSILDTDKGVWQTARYTWMILTLYNEVERREAWLQTGKHGIDFLEKHCYDETGKLFFLVDKQGRPLRMRRYVYSEAFAAIAYAAYYKATGLEQYREKAVETFERFRDYNYTPGLIPPKFSDHRRMRSMGVPMIGIVTAQELRQNLNDESYTDHISAWIWEIEQYFLNHQYRAVMETVGPEGEFLDHFDGRTLNPGHALEGAWFILREALYRQRDPELVRLGCTMTDWMWEIGWDKTYGGIYYFRDVNGLPVQEYWHDMNFWWPQTEAVIATLMAYQLSGDLKYAGWHGEIHQWAFQHFPDPEHGDWFGYLHRDGRLSVPLKGNNWKGPFHVPRMHYMAWKICEDLLTTKV